MKVYDCNPNNNHMHITLDYAHIDLHTFQKRAERVNRSLCVAVSTDSHARSFGIRSVMSSHTRSKSTFSTARLSVGAQGVYGVRFTEHVSPPADIDPLHIEGVFIWYRWHKYIAILELYFVPCSYWCMPQLCSRVRAARLQRRQEQVGRWVSSVPVIEVERLVRSTMTTRRSLCERSQSASTMSA